MPPKALVIDDDPDILDAVADILESMGHECDLADSVESARQCLDGGEYAYVLLDLEIPVRAGRNLPRIQNGENLLQEIIQRSGTQRKPVIVMTAHGTDGPYLAVDVMKKGAVDYVTKPFKTVGRTLDKSILEALARQDDATLPLPQGVGIATCPDRLAAAVSRFDQQFPDAPVTAEDLFVRSVVLRRILEFAPDDERLPMVNRCVLDLWEHAYRIDPNSALPDTPKRDDLQRQQDALQAVNEIIEWVRNLIPEVVDATLHRLDNYCPRPEWWDVGDFARRNPSTDLYGRPVYDDVVWPATGIETLEELVVYLRQTLDLVESLSGEEPPNAQIGLEHGRRAVRNGRRWLNRHAFKSYPTDPPNVEHLTADETESVLRATIDAITDEGTLSPLSVQIDRSPARSDQPVLHGDQQETRPFTGGEMVFHADHVELCGVDICSGSRAKRYRRTLELLAKKDDSGAFETYSCVDLADLVGISPNETDAKRRESNAAGHIRHLRGRISKAFQRETGTGCEDEDVILSRGPGYRFADCISVQFADQPEITDITDIDDSEDVRNDDVLDVFNVRNDEAERRREWILQQLRDGVQLKAPMVADQFKRSKKTAQRDLDTLRDEGKIEFVGDRRTGYYRLCPPSESEP